jgi:hypothetical protein
MPTGVRKSNPPYRVFRRRLILTNTPPPHLAAPPDETVLLATVVLLPPFSRLDVRRMVDVERAP